MEKTVNIHAAKTNLSQLIAEAEAGADIIIARAGKPVVRLVSVKKKKPPLADRRPGQMKGKIWIGPNFYDPLPEEIMKAFRGEGD
ncbi:MAG TPA: type II toxin-antitoxin system prevent-host-death family antitoxin [Rhizomicrobium sp.]|jgi:prevent-host-death family protein